MAWQARVNLGLSDCLEEDDPNAGDVVEFTVELPQGPWVQFIYDGLMDQDGNSLDLHLDTESGFWIHNKLRWSDLNIQIIEVSNG